MNRVGLFWRFMLVGIPTTLLLVFILLGWVYIGLKGQIHSATDHRAGLLAEAMAENTDIRLSLQSRDKQLAQEQADRFLGLDDGIEYIIVTDDKNAVLAVVRRTPETSLPEGYARERLLSDHGSRGQGDDLVVHKTVDVTMATEEEPVEGGDGWFLDLGDEEEEPAPKSPKAADSQAATKLLGKVLVSVGSEEQFKSTMYNLAFVLFLMPVFFFIAISLLFTYIFRRITHMVVFARTVATGDLAQRMEAGTGDELGVLASALNQMTQNLSSVLARVARVSSELGLVISRITQSANGVAKGAEQQHASLEKTQQELDEMANSLRETARNVEAISRLAHESTEDAKAIGERNTTVNLDLERLGGAIQTMSSSVEQVAENISSTARHVEILSQASGESESAINRTENALQAVRRLADNSSKIAERVAAEAREGAVSVAASLGSINKLEGTMADVRGATSGLTDRLGTVGAFLQAIVDVARRTNLLSLNAAIIASQAGEHGRQFQVVAEEVKALAAQTAGLTHDIERVLSEIGKAGEAAHIAVSGASEAVTEGVTQTQKAGAVLERILDATEQTAQMSQEIAQAMAEREADLQRVTRAMERVVTVTSDIRSVTRTQVTAAEVMRDAAQTIQAVADAVGKSTEQQLAGSVRIGRALSDVSESVSRLSNTRADQAQGGERILGAVEEVRKVAARSRGEARSLEQTLEVLVVQAAELRGEIDRFVIGEHLLAGTDTRPPAPAPPQ